MASSLYSGLVATFLIGRHNNVANLLCRCNHVPEMQFVLKYWQFMRLVEHTLIELFLPGGVGWRVNPIAQLATHQKLP